jgi:predicted SAM-dependent methyltransferase
MEMATVSAPRKLNLGCGPVQPAGWVNVDGSIRAWIACRLAPVDRFLVLTKLWPATEFGKQTVVTNLRKRLPWAEASVDAVYMGEVLEHFTRADGFALLQECFRVLKPGGVLRLRVPDNAQFWGNYVREYEATRARPRSEWTLSHSRWVEMFFNDISVRRTWFGSYGHFHKWMYDEVSLVLTLEQAGFRHAGRRAYLDSAINDVAAVENRNDLIVEAIK